MDSLRSSEIIKLRTVLWDVLKCKQCSWNDLSEFDNLSEFAPYIKKYTSWYGLILSQKLSYNSPESNSPWFNVSE
jgi:hypothetical protein